MRHLLPLLFAAVLLSACGTARQPGAADPRIAREGVPHTLQSDPFLDTLQQRTFAWFWETTNPANGLVPDRAPSRPFSSIAAVGFGLTAYGVGAERGYVTRDQAAERTLNTLRFFWNAPMGPDSVGTTGYRGFYYHFLDMDTGLRNRKTELSSIDTGLLMMGVLFAQSYFDRDTPEEKEIRALADSLYLRTEWGWMQAQSPLMTMAWRPERQFGRAEYKGFDEAMFLYVLGMGSPTHPASADAWEAFTDSYLWGEFYGREYVQFSPLFGYQYSHVWIDPRGLTDDYLREKGIDYFENARRATLAHRAYAIDNPGGFRDYGPQIWGLTACDGPGGGRRLVDGDTVNFRAYWARGASLRHINDDGTIAPTAAGGSIPFAPEETVAALKAMRARYGDLIFNRHGFVDAFNPTFTFTDATPNRGRVHPVHGWFDDDHLGIDQGPILLMAENYRTGFVWDVMKKNEHLVRGLCRAGMRGNFECRTSNVE